MTSPKAFGEMLRRQRERHGITLQAVADQTKIATSMLKALERGDCSKWPGGIYSRAWIRSYAAAIGLDADDIGAEFNRCFNRVAFPDGEPTPAAPAAPREMRRITPLRMTLETDPSERMRVAVRRTALFVADIALSGLMATLVSVLTVLSFWTIFTVAAVLCHAVGLFGGGGSAVGFIERTVRHHARPHEDASDQSAVAELA